ncbi:hypothetical protein BASA81_006697 [Batrachochytrium salamandrivorans]|nr:hypothetical protein BASA81_006697 [Batrachochytrium salamandrivorans]
MRKQQRVMEEWEQVWKEMDQGEEKESGFNTLVHDLYLEQLNALMVSRVSVFERYLHASAGERHDVAYQVYIDRLALEQLKRCKDYGFDLIFPLCHALHKYGSNNEANGEELQALALGVELQGDTEQKLVWFALCQFPPQHYRLLPIELLTVRILPRFIGGTKVFQSALARHLQDISQSKQLVIDEITSEQFMTSG